MGWSTPATWLPGDYDQVVFRGDPAVRRDAISEFLAFWVKGGRVLAGMNVNIWDVQDDIQKLVRAGFAGKTVHHVAPLPSCRRTATLPCAASFKV